MAVSKKGNNRTNRRVGAPATTVEGREDQLTSLAIDLAEKQLLAGTASAQVIVHYLRLGTTRERLEKEKLMEENRLLKAKTERLQSEKKIEELYLNALDAMSSYKPRTEEADDSDDYDP